MEIAIKTGQSGRVGPLLQEIRFYRRSLPDAHLDLLFQLSAGVAELADATDSKFIKRGFHGVLSR